MRFMFHIFSDPPKHATRYRVREELEKEAYSKGGSEFEEMHVNVCRDNINATIKASDASRMG